MKGEFGIKILFVSPYFVPAYSFGGPAAVAYSVAKELVKRQHEVVVYTSDAKDSSSRLNVETFKILDGIKIYYLKNISTLPVKASKLFLTPDLIPMAKKHLNEFDIIHLHEYRSFQNIIIHHYASKHKIPYILQAHGGLPRIMSKNSLKEIFDKAFGYNLLSHASKVIALNLQEAKQYREIAVPDTKIEIIPNGLSFSEFSILPPKGYFKKKFGIEANKRIILYLGRINRIKGVDILVKAFAQLKNNLEVTDSVLVLVGPDDGFLEYIRFLTNSLRLENTVVFVGPVFGKDKLAAYVDAEVFILPSIYEAFPMTVLEAYACGKPIIASKIGGLNDLVFSNKVNTLFESGNVQQLALCILNLLKDTEQAKKLGLEGKNYVKENFSIEHIVDKLEKVYESVV